jgi:hypothetical protein
VSVPVVGQVFGQLVVVGDAPPRREPGGTLTRMVIVQCACGSPPRLVRWANLRSGNSTSCGCRQRMLASERMRLRRAASLNRT